MFCGASGAIEKLEELHQFRVIVYIRNPGRPSRSLPQTKSKLQDPSIAYISTSQNKSDLRSNTSSIVFKEKASTRSPKTWLARGAREVQSAFDEMSTQCGGGAGRAAQKRR